MDKILEFMHKVGNLKRIRRSGWTNHKIKNPESIADHICRTAILAMILSKKLKVNQNKLIKMALIHDLPESLVGDIIVEGPSKKSSFKNKNKKESVAMQNIISSLKNGKEYYNLWLEFEQGKSKESKILRQLDKLEMVIQASEYEKQYNKKLNEFWISARRYIKDKELVKILNNLEYKKLI